MSVINGKNQPWHPVEHLAYWNCEAAELKEQAENYDALASSSELKKRLDSLLGWARENRSMEDFYNDSYSELD